MAPSIRAAFDAANDVLTIATIAAANPANTPEAREAAFDLRTAISAQMEMLDQAMLIGEPGLQAAAVPMNSGMDRLQALQSTIEAFGSGIDECMPLVSGIDHVVRELRALGFGGTSGTGPRLR